MTPRFLAQAIDRMELPKTREGRLQESRYEEKIKGFILDMLSLRCLLHIQVEMTSRQWEKAGVWKSRVEKVFSKEERSQTLVSYDLPS